MDCKTHSKCKKNKKISAKYRKNNVKTNNRRQILNPNKISGIFPLIPIFSGLSALKSLASGASDVYNSIVNSAIGIDINMNCSVTFIDSRI